MSETLPGGWYRDRDTLERVVTEYGSFRAAATRTGADRDNLRMWWSRHGLPEFAPTKPPVEVLAAPVPAGIDLDALRGALRTHRKGVTVLDLADAMDTSPRRVQAGLATLREQGYRVGERGVDGIVLERGLPVQTQVYPNMLPLLDGTLVRYGLVSDTHLGSDEEALGELHAAYDFFEREGIETVLHAGDWVTGIGVFRGQHSEIKVHTVTDQAKYAIANYPQRKGIRTIGIAGNHDLEGDAGKLGYDPVYVIAAQRDDITYLEGGMDAWIELGADQVENAPYVHLMHGKGGMSYAYSYKAQKLVDGYPSGRKPAILHPGHWHVEGTITARSVRVTWPSCFEHQSIFMRRLGLHPVVGFHVIEATVAGDGSVVQYLPRDLRFFDGRIVG
jgi:rhodanese-related sulfurtransferase